MNQNNNINLTTPPCKDMLSNNNPQLFKLNFDILIKNKRDEINKIAKNIGIKNVSSLDGKYLSKNILVNIILNNDNYNWILDKKNKTTKKCNKCNIEKPFIKFNKDKNMKDGLKHHCKDCKSICDIKRINTLNGCLCLLINNSKYSACKRKEQGRIDAGISNITLSDLEKLWRNQDGKCYYSNISMNYDKRDWKVSLERLNTNKGYIKDNIVLCCQEFNSSCQWSKEKIKEMIEILNKDIKDNCTNFELENKERKTPQKIIKTIINDIEYYNCNYCNKIKSVNMFYKKINNGCKECKLIKDKNNENNSRKSFQRLINSAKTNTKERIKKNNTKRDNSFNIDFDYLVELYNKQKGLCAYSNLPLQFGNYLEKNWTCSLERINVLKGYVKGNVCLICLEFNTGDRKIMYKNEEEGSCGWSKEKFKMFLTELKN